jgi:hypothetical protein
MDHTAMKAQYLVDVKLQFILDSFDDPNEIAENIYARCADFAYSEDHLLLLEVIPCPIPPIITDDGSRDLRDAPAEQT